jgi:hypothetical protein
MPTGCYQQARNGVKRVLWYGKLILFNGRRISAGPTSTRWSDKLKLLGAPLDPSGRGP